MKDGGDCLAKFSTLTGTSFQVLHGSGLLSSINWTWFKVVYQVWSTRKCKRSGS